MSNSSSDIELEKLRKFIEEYMKLDQQIQRPKSIFSVIGGGKERKFQDALIYFLDPTESHGFKKTILKHFLKIIEKITSFDSPVKSELEEQSVKIVKEINSEEHGRVDLGIVGGNTRPEWAIISELKVGQTPKKSQLNSYSKANWDWSWHGGSKIKLDDSQITKVLIKKNNSQVQPEMPEDWESIDWRDLAKEFDSEGFKRGFFDFPHRSVTQFLDFVRSMKDVEGLPDSVEEQNKINLIKKFCLFEKHNVDKMEFDQAEEIYDTELKKLAECIQKSWPNILEDEFLFQESGWELPSTNENYPRLQWIRPERWVQYVSEFSGTAFIGFVHSPTKDKLRKRELSFRLRLPETRFAHKTSPSGKKESFKSYFLNHEEAYPKSQKLIEKQLDKVVEKADLKHIEGPGGSAGRIFEVVYKIPSEDGLFNDYIKTLKRAVREICGNPELIKEIDKIFIKSFSEVFGEDQLELTDETIHPLKPKNDD